VGLAASVGAGISMGFAEALSDDGKISGRGGPLLRGTVCGLMTTLGGIGHTLPYLISDFRDGHRHRGRRRTRRTGRDLVDPLALHGDIARRRDHAGCGRRRVGVRRRLADRLNLIPKIRWAVRAGDHDGFAAGTAIALAVGAGRPRAPGLVPRSGEPAEILRSTVL